MELEVVNINGEKTGRTVTLSDEIFGIEPNDHVIYLDVKRYQINQRQGTHKAKERHEISGSTKKLRKQKGGGGARIGGIKSPLLRGGGRIFGPRPRTYDLKLNKKVKTLARRSALSYKVKENALIVVENFDMATPRTKDYINILNALNVYNKRSLLVLEDRKDNVLLSIRNLPQAYVTLSRDLNTYSVIHANALIIEEAALNSLNENLK